MSDLMSHRGLVTEKRMDGTAVVEVMRDHACTGCQEHGACTMQSANNVRVRFKNAHDLEKGDSVLINIKKTDFFKSMFTVYIAPLIIMLITAITSDSLQSSQPITASLTLISIAVYFLLLKLLHKGRDKQTYVKLSD